MALYNAGNRILSSDEYYAELIFKWRLALFAIGGFLTGFIVHESLPAEWEKAVRFALIIAAGSAGGGVLAYFAREIEAMAGWAVRLGVLFVIAGVIWSLI